MRVEKVKCYTVNIFHRLSRRVPIIIRTSQILKLLFSYLTPEF